MIFNFFSITQCKLSFNHKKISSNFNQRENYESLLSLTHSKNTMIMQDTQLLKTCITTIQYLKYTSNWTRKKTCRNPQECFSVNIMDSTFFILTFLLKILNMLKEKYKIPVKDYKQLLYYKTVTLYIKLQSWN